MMKNSVSFLEIALIMVNIWIAIFIIFLSLSIHKKHAYNIILKSLISAEKKSPKKSLFYRIIKRLVDILISIFVLITISPTMLLLVIVVKIIGEKIILKRYSCVTYKDKVVKFSKIDIVDKNNNNTQMNRKIRIMGLNNVPILLSVLKGDMSIIGLSKVGFEDSERWMYDYEKPGFISVGALFHIKNKTATEVDKLYISARGFIIDLRIFLYLIANNL